MIRITNTREGERMKKRTFQTLSHVVVLVPGGPVGMETSSKCSQPGGVRGVRHNSVLLGDFGVSLPGRVQGLLDKEVLLP